MKTRIYRINEDFSYPAFTYGNEFNLKYIDLVHKLIAEVDEELEFDNMKIGNTLYHPRFSELIEGVKCIFMSPYKLKKSLKEGKTKVTREGIGECPACGHIMDDVHERGNGPTTCYVCDCKLDVSSKVEEDFYRGQSVFIWYYTLLLEKIVRPKIEVK